MRGEGTIMWPFPMIREEIAVSGGDGVPML